MPCDDHKLQTLNDMKFIQRILRDNLYANKKTSHKLDFFSSLVLRPSILFSTRQWKWWKPVRTYRAE